MMSGLAIKTMRVYLIQIIYINIYVCVYVYKSIYTYSKSYLQSCHINRYFYDHLCCHFTVMLESYFIPLKVLVKCKKLFFKTTLNFLGKMQDKLGTV